jgi:hypothetical protein
MCAIDENMCLGVGGQEAVNLLGYFIASACVPYVLRKHGTGFFKSLYEYLESHLQVVLGTDTSGLRRQAGMIGFITLQQSAPSQMTWVCGP